MSVDRQKLCQCDAGWRRLVALILNRNQQFNSKEKYAENDVFCRLGRFYGYLPAFSDG